MYWIATIRTQKLHWKTWPELLRLLANQRSGILRWVTWKKLAVTFMQPVRDLNSKKYLIFPNLIEARILAKNPTCAVGGGFQLWPFRDAERRDWNNKMMQSALAGIEVEGKCGWCFFGAKTNLNTIHPLKRPSNLKSPNWNLHFQFPCQFSTVYS